MLRFEALQVSAQSDRGVGGMLILQLDGDLALARHENYNSNVYYRPKRGIITEAKDVQSIAEMEEWLEYGKNTVGVLPNLNAMKDIAARDVVNELKVPALFLGPNVYGKEHEWMDSIWPSVHTDLNEGNGHPVPIMTSEQFWKCFPHTLKAVETAWKARMDEFQPPQYDWATESQTTLMHLLCNQQVKADELMKALKAHGFETKAKVKDLFGGGWLIEPDMTVEQFIRSV